MLAVHTIGRGVLADDQKLFDARLDQFFGFAQDGMGRSRHQTAAHVGDDAELARVVAAFRDFQIAVVARGQLDAGRGQQVHKGVGLGWNGGVHGIQNGLVLVRAGHGQHLGVCSGDVLGIRAKTARHDDPTILLQGLTDGRQAFRLGGIEKSAGVDDHGIGPLVFGRDGVALGPQPGEDALRIDQSLGAAQRHHADGRLTRPVRVHPAVIGNAGAGKIGAKVGRVLGHGTMGRG